jgi:hypothetical protein
MPNKAAIVRRVNQPIKPDMGQTKPGQGGSDKGRHNVSGKAPTQAQAEGKKNPGKKKPAKPAKPAPPKTANDYALQDPDYRRAIAGYRTNLANMKAQTTANKNDLSQDFTTTRDRLMQSFDQSNKNQRDDFAARGIFGSGVYAKAKTDAQNEQTNQLNDANNSYTRNARQLDTDIANSTTLESQQESTAKAAAIRRAAAKYGITGRPAVAKAKGKPVRKRP